MNCSETMPYEILEEVGSGPFGTLYRGRHRHLVGSEVAIQVLEDPNVCDLLRQVGSIDDCADLKGSARVRDCHLIAETPYLVTDWIEGQSLRTLLKEKGTPTRDQAISWVQSIALILLQAHQRGLIHQNLQPEHIRITPNGEVVLDDLVIGGTLARAGATYFPSAQTSLDREYLSGMRYKTIRQREAGTVDAREDLFALGLILFELLVGRFPLPGELPSHVRSEIGQDVDRIYACCCTHVEKRYSNVEGFLADVEALSDEKSISSAQQSELGKDEGEDTFLINLVELCGSNKLEERSLHVLKEQFESLLAGPITTVCLGLQGIDHVSSSGLSYLVSVGDRLTQRGGSLLLHGVESRIEQIIEMLGLDSVYRLFATEEDALQSIDKRG